MPATRTSSIPSHSRHTPVPSTPKNIREAPFDSEVISLASSSDAENPRARPTIRRHSKPRPTARPKKSSAPVPAQEIIEISDDDSPAEVSTQPSVIADFKRQINRLREESVKHKRAFERASRELREVKDENCQLHALYKPEKGKITLDSNQLMDQLDCEICSLRMWTPYVLPDCGHAFCEPCLQSWFSRAKTEFMSAHPHNPPDQLTNSALVAQIIQSLAHSPQLVNDRHVMNMFWHCMPPRPTYTCPTCREPVYSRPTEVFTLKSLVRTVSAAIGESSPQKKGSTNQKGKAPATARGDPWSQFFAPKRT